ncbi:ribosome quality control complex subunit 1 [[Candida] anglica]|uniref:Ribosome quality control complex subunit 1 n=1 Tax=[Candida] anglica TaxID=148631 RepID=A0ABP0EBW5_9ASCO
MSSRALRRLERQKFGELGGNTETPSDNEVESDYEPPQKSFNAFAFLNGEEESNDEEDSVSDAESSKAQEPKKEQEVKKNKKSKKSKKSKSKETVDSDEELDKFLAEVKRKDQEKYSASNGNTPEIESEDEDEYEWEYNEEEDVKEYDSNYKFFTSARLEKSLSVLSIKSVKNLDADQEFRNLFGKLSVDTIEDANTTTSLAISPEVLQQFKRLARLTRGWGGKDRRNVPGTTRKLLLSRIRDDWLPTAQKPLGMEEIKPKDMLEYMSYKEDTADSAELSAKINREAKLGVKYYHFTKLNNSVQDRVANSRFYAAVVMTPDPESLMQLLQQFPYHAETLLQVAMVLLRQGSDKSTSNALIEKALFVFDRCFHKSFHESLSEGQNGLVRLPYEGFMNRQFHLCLFRYIINLGERSTFFTALNYCKFLLSLCPAEDPIGVRYFVDFYAIMSEEYSWLLQLVQSPLVTTYSKWLTPGLAFSAVLAHLRRNDQENAKKQLKLAFTKHRYVAFKLLEVIGLPYKLPSNENFTPSEETLLAAETYLVRAAILWKEQGEREFLHDELLKLFSEVPNKESTSFLSSIWGSSKSDENKSIPFNLVRFAILSGENKIMAKVPESVWARDDVFEYDILPPHDNSSAYNEFTGVSGGHVVDSLFDYVDQNVLGAIVQNQTAGENDLADIIDQLELGDEAEAEN